MLRWRAEEDKVRREWWAPVTPDVREALELLRRTRPALATRFCSRGQTILPRP